MIYRKDANFPYPVMSNTSSSFSENYFNLDVEVSENGEFYRFDFNYEIDSEFMKGLLINGKAQLILIIQSRDNKFFKLNLYQGKVEIHKSRISINNRTSIQMHIQALQDINFSENHDLNEFYNQFKEELNVPKFSLLGYSNVIVFDGSMKQPYQLFEKKLDENLKSDIKIELGLETIIIHYKHRDYQLTGLPNALNNAYIYTGLTKALQSFVINNSDDEDIYLADLEEPEGLLDLKLYNLMKSKNVTDINMDNIDEVIYQISDRIVERFTSAIKEVESIGS